MPDEMINLRNALDARGVEWVNESDNLDRSFPFLNLIMYRTSFKWKSKRYSVICGYGTLGGTKGLLELHVDNDTTGSLTAVDVLRIIDEVEDDS
jgi:hypothetical protein